jgi:hypothetical protein
MVEEYCLVITQAGRGGGGGRHAAVEQVKFCGNLCLNGTPINKPEQNNTQKRN